MNDDWTQDTTDVLHCSMPPQVRAHIEELRDEVARLRAAEVPHSSAAVLGYTSAYASIGGWTVTNGYDGHCLEGTQEAAQPWADNACVVAVVRIGADGRIGS